jgi:hypothetical protein
MCNLEDDAATRRRAQEQAVGSAVAVASSALFPPLSKRLIDALLPRVHKMQVYSSFSSAESSGPSTQVFCIVSTSVQVLAAAV